MTTWITVCDTCKRDDWNPTGSNPNTDGENLAGMVETAAHGHDSIETRRVSCTMGCKRACNITIQAEGKLCYTLGEFAPDAEAAQAIVDYAALHAQSDRGQVPYRQWPEGVKGHFVTRMHPIPTPDSDQ